MHAVHKDSQYEMSKWVRSANVERFFFINDVQFINGKISIQSLCGELENMSALKN